MLTGQVSWTRFIEGNEEVKQILTGDEGTPYVVCGQGRLYFNGSVYSEGTDACSVHRFSPSGQPDAIWKFPFRIRQAVYHPASGSFYFCGNYSTPFQVNGNSITVRGNGDGLI